MAIEIRVKEKNEIEKIRTALATFMTSDISGFGSAITLSLATTRFTVGIQEMVAIGIFTKGISIAWAAAGILSLISVSGTSASSTALRTVIRYGTKMWVLFITTLIFYILLKIFKKTELEKFVLNCVLSDYRKLPAEIKSKHPAEVMNYFYDNREQLTNKAAAPFRDFVFALNYYEDEILELLPSTFPMPDSECL